jgi:hypothetical protein
MSINPEFDAVVSFQPRIQEVEVVPPEPVALREPDTTLDPALPTASSAPAEVVASQPFQATTRRRPVWMIPATVAAVGLIASSTLGYFLYTTSGQRDTVTHQLASTQATLTTTKADLSAAQADAADKKVTADYTSLFIANNGAVQIDYQNTIVCQCLTPRAGVTASAAGECTPFNGMLFGS